MARLFTSRVAPVPHRTPAQPTTPARHPWRIVELASDMRLPPKDSPGEAGPLTMGLLLPAKGSSDSGDVFSIQGEGRQDAVAPSTPQEDPLDYDEFGMPVTSAPAVCPASVALMWRAPKARLPFMDFFSYLFLLGRYSLRSRGRAIHISLVRDDVLLASLILQSMFATTLENSAESAMTSGPLVKHGGSVGAEESSPRRHALDSLSSLSLRR
ncbi:hypothetical protein MRX96_014216 [Rhipicephalus microplus]